MNNVESTLRSLIARDCATNRPSGEKRTSGEISRITLEKRRSGELRPPDALLYPSRLLIPYCAADFAPALTNPNARLLDPIQVRIDASLVEDQFRRPSVGTRNKRHLDL